MASESPCVSFREGPATTRDRVVFDGSVSNQTREDLESALRAVIDYAVLSQGIPPHIASEVLTQYACDEATFVVEVARG